VIETPADLFDEWMSLPLSVEGDDPRFNVRRAAPEDYERIYDCVDAAFGKKRPRALYDWLYRENPFGRARVWIVEEIATERILKTGAFYPWPIWRGDRPLRGSLSGDAATVPDWQRKGLSSIRRKVRRGHPWSRKIATIAGPNEGSRTVTTKAGEGSSMLGPLKGGVAVLRGAPLFERAGLPRFLSEPLGAVAGGAFSALRSLTIERGPTPQVEVIDRFTSDLDAITLATMNFPLYWCPHNADFLNWRYLDHPVETYRGLALVSEGRPVAYSVLRVDGDESTISEFAAAPEHAAQLMTATLAHAREANCGYTTFFAPPAWRHWGIFRRAGFIPYTTNNHLDGVYWPEKEESERMDAWQVTPGDRDFH